MRLRPGADLDTACFLPPLPCMRARDLLFGTVLLVIVGCDGDRTVIRGSLTPADTGCEGDRVLQVAIAGSADTARIRDCRFTLKTTASGSFSLRFLRDGKAAGRMYVEGLPPAVRLTLRDVWFDERLAFPTSVALKGAEAVTINGLRMAEANRLPRRLQEDATVLGRSDDADALLVRPSDPSLPDLYVRSDAGTRVVATDGSPGSLARLSAGDPVRIEAAHAGDYLLAQRIVVPAPPRREERARDREGRGRRGPDDLIGELERVFEEIGRQVPRALEEEIRRRGRRRP